MSSELENSGIRVAVGDCSVTERRRWCPPYQTGKTVHVHAKHYKHNEEGGTAPGVCGNESVTLSHSGNVVTRIGIHTHSVHFLRCHHECQEIFIFPKRSFGQKNPELRAFNPQWFTQSPWLHYDEVFIIQTVFTMYVLSLTPADTCRRNDVEVTSMQQNDVNENLSTYYTVPITFSMHFLCINETNLR